MWIRWEGPGDGWRRVVAVVAGELPGRIARVGVAVGAAAVLAASVGGGGQAGATVRASARTLSAPVLLELVCKGASFCMALDGYPRPGGPVGPARLEEWNGRSWRVIPDPHPLPACSISPAPGRRSAWPIPRL